MARESKSGENPSFEKAFARLKEVVAALETEELSLDKSLALFEEGIKLSRVCRAHLDAADGKIEQLLKVADGSERVVPFAADQGDVE